MDDHNDSVPAVLEGDLATIAFVKSYLGAMERGLSGDALGEFFASDAVELEMPNRIFPKGAKRTIAEMRQASERGRTLFSRQEYRPVSIVATPAAASVEFTWRGTLAVALGSLGAGSVMTAHVTMFMQMREGKIALLRHYDCFEGW